MESLNIEQIELLLLIGAIVAIAARRLKIPYTIGLVVGLVIAFPPFNLDNFYHSRHQRSAAGICVDNRSDFDCDFSRNDWQSGGDLSGFGNVFALVFENRRQTPAHFILGRLARRAVVAFSVFVQGLTVTPLLRRFGQIPHQKETGKT